MALKGVPFTSKIESPGFNPTLSAILPSSILLMYTPTLPSSKINKGMKIKKMNK